MIIAERKPIKEIEKMIMPYKKVLIVGCNTCVTICMAGGEKEVDILASSLNLLFKSKHKEIEFIKRVVERQCEKEFVEELKEDIASVEAVLSLGCGVGVQKIVEVFPHIPVYPGLNTKSIGAPEEEGVWKEKCVACGDCILDKTGGICPIARCSKKLLNGPCGGSQDGKCEIDKNLDCAWQLIYDRLKLLGKLDQLEEIIPVRDWSKANDGGPREVIREDVRLKNGK
ncbi:methylenetetrahydrofolate reductase C-terminal domain-containing protein [Candidatus Aerophobetes bacterium]|nr:methylenetetrahydrofolate reductase C-terminal domain-containing protein [Candidatus Aerophobetes bacterium]